MKDGWNNAFQKVGESRDLTTFTNNSTYKYNYICLYSFINNTERLGITMRVSKMIHFCNFHKFD